MKSTITALTAASLKELDDIYGFFAYTNLSYKMFSDAVSSGFKTTAIITNRNLRVDQNDLKVKFDGFSKSYLGEVAFQLSVSAFEVWLFDLLRILLSDVHRLNKKRKIDVADVIAAKSLGDLLTTIVDFELNEIRYKKPAEWFEYLWSFVGVASPSAIDIAKLCEIKASRDILAHNNGLANSTYISKSGALARVRDGDPIDVSPAYWVNSWQHLREIVETVGSLVASRVPS